MAFFNHNSFVILALLIWVVAVIALRQRGWKRSSWLIVGSLTTLLLAGYFALRPAEAASDQAAEIRAQIGQGMPVLLELQSQN
jgi:hypothetical protein